MNWEEEGAALLEICRRQKEKIRVVEGRRELCRNHYLYSVVIKKWVPFEKWIYRGSEDAKVDKK